MITNCCRLEKAPQVVNIFQNDIYEMKQHWHTLLEEHFAALFTSRMVLVT